MNLKLNHFLIPYLAVLAFMLGGIIGSDSLGWYRALTLPSFHPSEGLIALIWAVIYVFATWSLLIVWNTLPRGGRFVIAMWSFAITTALNIAWSIVFFHFHLFMPSIWLAILLGISLIELGAVVYPHSKKAALLLLPYIAWVFFAAYLNYAVMLLN